MLIGIDCLCVGAIGGALVSGAFFCVMYFNFQSKYKDYFFNKENFKTRVAVDRLLTDVAGLKMQVAVLNAESYHACVEEKYSAPHNNAGL